MGIMKEVMSADEAIEVCHELSKFLVKIAEIRQMRAVTKPGGYGNRREDFTVAFQRKS